MKTKEMSKQDYKSGFMHRIKDAIGKNSINSFAVNCGINVSLLRKYLSGTIPGLDKATAIADTAGVTLHWLATGEGPMRMDDWESEMESRLADQMRIRKYTAVAAAGDNNRTTDDDYDYVTFSKSWLKQHIGSNLANLSIIDARGDSMQPDISDGDSLIVDNSVKTVESDGIYVISVDDDLLVKRLQRTMDGGIIVKSTNPRYSDYELNAKNARDLSIKGRVRWHGRSI